MHLLFWRYAYYVSDGLLIPSPCLQHDWLCTSCFPVTATVFSCELSLPLLLTCWLQWHPVLLTLKNQVEENTGHTFNSLLCNLYRSEKDSVDWHSDDEPSLGRRPIIASLSFGATRVFEMRRKPPPVSSLSVYFMFLLPYDNLWEKKLGS